MHPANREKLHLHYLNVTNQGAVGDVIVPNLATNLVPWDRMRFFTNAAERMLRAQYGTGFREGIVIHPTNLYSAAVHRLFQLAANLADLQTDSAYLSDYPYFPSVYRPVFRRLGTNLVVSGFTEVTNDLFYTALPRIDLTATNVMARFPEENRDYHVNVFGIPTVVSARKGWPNFNEFHLQTSVQVTRRLEAYKPRLR